MTGLLIGGAVYAGALLFALSLCAAASNGDHATELVLHGRERDDCALGPIHEPPCLLETVLDGPDVGATREPTQGNSLHPDSQ